MKTVALAAFALIAGSGLAFAETSVEMKDAPVAVQAAAMNAAQQHMAKIEAIAIDTDGGRATYEVRTSSADGKMREFDFFADGSLDEIETIITEAEIPANVMATYKRYFPNSKIGKVEHSMRGNGALWFETDTVNSDGKEIDVDISGDGTAILIADDNVN
jgi:uncharacterized membrane protein YkoI